MQIEQISSADHHQPASDPEPQWAGYPEAVFGGFTFRGDAPPEAAGVYVLARRIGDVLYPVLIGETERLATTTAEIAGPAGAYADYVDACFWIERSLARQRAYMVRDLVGKYDPPLNVEHRKGRAAPEIAALVPDHASYLAGGSSDAAAEPIVVSKGEIARLVREFYADAMADPMIGPVFRRSVADWDGHLQVVQEFWSHALLGATGYGGNPFSPHLPLRLKPEYFDRWLDLFRTTATRVLQPAAARRAIGKVEHMSECFQAGLFLPKQNA
jgi:truncated hemoglobin YjbI